jgi:hypothetical protein
LTAAMTASSHCMRADVQVRQLGRPMSAPSGAQYSRLCRSRCSRGVAASAHLSVCYCRSRLKRPR